MPAVPKMLRRCPPLLAQVAEQRWAATQATEGCCVLPKLPWIFAEPLLFSSSSPHKQEYLCFGGRGARGKPSCTPWPGDPEAWAFHSTISANLAFCYI